MVLQNNPPRNSVARECPQSPWTGIWTAHSGDGLGPQLSSDDSKGWGLDDFRLEHPLQDDISGASLSPTGMAEARLHWPTGGSLSSIRPQRVGLLGWSAGFHLQIQDVGPSMSAGWKIAQKGVSKPASAGGREDGAMGRDCCRRQLRNHHDLDQLFSNPSPERGLGLPPF